MAHLLHVIYSDTIHGAGIAAAAPFACAHLFTEAGSCDAKPSKVQVAKLESLARLLSDRGLVSDIKNLKDDAVWLYSGSKDSVVDPGELQLVSEFYQNFGSKVQWKSDLAAEHAWPSLNTPLTDSSCTSISEKGTTNCAFDGAAAMFKHIIPKPLRPKVPIGTWNKFGNLFLFDQTEFGSDQQSLDETGYVYIPNTCMNALSRRCMVHVALHGCQNARSSVHNGETAYDIVPKYWGHLEWAALNDIIVLFP